MTGGEKLIQQAQDVLHANDIGGEFTQPASGLYGHQWFWDSCFIAIGQRHYDLPRAQQELEHILQGQWQNGMIPHIVLAEDDRLARYFGVWQSWLSPHSPDNISTSGITQPPMLAESVVRIGEKLPTTERRSWYKQIWPHLIAYHQWLYGERDPHGEGLVTLIDPCESGMDNTPPEIMTLLSHRLPLWIRAIHTLQLETFLNRFRSDTRFVPAEQRMTTIEGLAMYSLQLHLRRQAYDSTRILENPAFAIQDVGYNAILIRANSLLRTIAEAANYHIPSELEKRMALAEQALEQLWDPETGQYYSRDAVTHQLLKVPTSATLLPLYAGCISPKRAQRLVKLLEDEKLFGPAYPVPSVATSSEWFDQSRYWQGPSWVNINWLIIDGLKRYGFTAYAEALRDSTLEMIRQSGMYEYFNPVTGVGLGAPNFSWTAALTIDLLKQEL